MEVVLTYTMTSVLLEAEINLRGKNCVRSILRARELHSEECVELDIYLRATLSVLMQ